MQWINETIIIILRPCTNKVFEREYINQINKVAKTSHSYLTLVCHPIFDLKVTFFDLKVKFWITTCKYFKVLEGNHMIAKK